MAKSKNPGETNPANNKPTMKPLTTLQRFCNITGQSKIAAKSILAKADDELAKSLEATDMQACKLAAKSIIDRHYADNKATTE